MKVLRTPDDQFAKLPDYPFLPNYLQLTPDLRMHYVDEGPKDGQVVLLLHGEPSWSFLYRFMIPVFADAGFRVIAPDLIGFGKSDKPTEMDEYTYASHTTWLQSFIEQLDLTEINLFCQDWGGLLGLRIAGLDNDRFTRIVAGNTFLPIGKGKPSEAFMEWREYSRTTEYLAVHKVMQNSTVRTLSETEIAAYVAPFPDPSYMAGAKIFPSLVPISEDDPAVPVNIQAFQTLSQSPKPFLCLFSDSDPVTKGGEKVFQKHYKGAEQMPHQIITDAGHFLQEDKGQEIANIIIEFIRNYE